MTDYLVFYVGYSSQVKPSFPKDDLLLRIIQKITGKNVRISSSIKDADLVLVYPYVVSSLFFKIKWVLSKVAGTLLLIDRDGINLRWLVGIGNKKALFVSHENLNRPYWWNTLGRFLINSDIPRLTFWPTEIDPDGERFPYWYNYIDWPAYPRTNGYPRFGRFYTLAELCSPLVFTPNRLDKVIAISSHLDHPRSALLKSLQSQFNCDIYGAAGSKLEGPKLDTMQQYRFAFCPENSAGFGYETEKIPEAWVAGCIPIGIFLNPFSQFNSDLQKIDAQNPDTFANIKLLEIEPSLAEIENYVRKIV